MKKPIPNSVVAERHTPIYSVHRYFARRPHNVFAAILDHYLTKPSLILDPFAGGGVTLVEGLTLNHRVLAADINPLACFVMAGQMTAVSPDEIREAVAACITYCEERIGFTYTFEGQKVYWYGWESFTLCPNCKKQTSLNPTTSVGNGGYVCESCRSRFKARLVNKDSISPTHLCVFTGDVWDQKAGTLVLEVSPQPLQRHHNSIHALLARSPFSISRSSKTPIPKCNLERESALHEKGFLNFEDFITEKNQAWILCFAEAIHALCKKNGKLRLVLFYLLAASIRYTSRFSSLNETWRKGDRPLEWAKSNFWTPYAFVELNPTIALLGRLDAYVKALKEHSARFPTCPVEGTLNAVCAGNAQYAIVNRPSQRFEDLEDNSIDLVLTDPPYGSYLNYGELSGFWLCWLRRLYPPMKGKKIINELEAITSRKVHQDNYKTFADYQADLERVFAECFRVLKPNHYLVFTFNNKEPEAWLALLRAVKRAGFHLPKGGVLFQDGVEEYKRTIALRRNGAIHGDFIYSFFKPTSKSARARTVRPLSWRDAVCNVLEKLFVDKKGIKNTDLYLNLNRELLPQLYDHLGSSAEADSSDLQDFDFKNLEMLLKEKLMFASGTWLKRGPERAS
jgi:putative DNA methylase